MPTNDGYPTDDELERIRTWPITWANYADAMALIAYLKTVFHWPERQIDESEGVNDLGRPVLVLWLHTGGWSGNESIIGALKVNHGVSITKVVTTGSRYQS